MLPKDKKELIEYLLETASNNIQNGLVTEEQLLNCLTPEQQLEYKLKCEDASEKAATYMYE